MSIHNIHFIDLTIAMFVTSLIFMLLTFTSIAAPPPDYYYSPLIKAVDKSDLNLVKFFLNGGVDVNAAKGFEGRTALHHAVAKGHFEMAKLLLDRGADVNIRDLRATALHIAVAKGHFEIAELLLDKGADIHAKNSDGMTALKWAQRRGNYELLNFLRARGAKE